ncbi:MAG: DUF4838 domain-containing protein [Clostridia bacterium]|nr:DUF4838 domain-containing protein [Clostridia bacterium]
MPENATDAETLAAEDLKKFFDEATGITLSVIPDSLAENLYSEVRYFSVGNTSLLTEAGIGLKKQDLGVDLGANGYILKTCEKNYGDINSRVVFMAGGDGYGTLYAVQEFLKETFGYEVYAVYAEGGDYVGANYTGEYTLETGVRNKAFSALDKVIVPDIEWLLSGYYAVAYRTGYLGEKEADLAEKKAWATRMGYQISNDILMYSTATELPINSIHNLVDYVPYNVWSAGHPEWYSNYYNSSIADTKVQLCLSNEEMYKTAFLPALQALILANENKKYVTITQEDYQNSWCTCSACLADKEKYGSNSGNYIQFANKVASDVKAWLDEEYDGREVNIVIFAYYDTAEPPVLKNTNGTYSAIDQSVVLSDNIVLYWVASRLGHNVNWSRPLNDTQYPINGVTNYAYYENLLQWSVLTSRLMVWSYNNNFVDYMTFFNTFDSLQANMQIFKEFGAGYVMNQGGTNNGFGSNFQDLKIYLSSKLRWDVNADVEALTSDFFANYYKDAATPMRTLYNTLLNKFGYATYSGVKTAIYLRRSIFSKADLYGYLGLIDEAYAAIAKYETTNPALYSKLYNRITREGLSYRYALIMLYGVDVDFRNGINYYESYYGACPETDKLTYAETVALQNAFMDDCKKVGLLAVAEAKHRTLLFAEWQEWQENNAPTK